MHVFGVDVGHVKLVQLIALLNNYSNLIFLTYVHCLTGIIVLLVIISCFYGKRETGITWEEDSFFGLSW